MSLVISTVCGAIVCVDWPDAATKNSEASTNDKNALLGSEQLKPTNCRLAVRTLQGIATHLRLNPDKPDKCPGVPIMLEAQSGRRIDTL